MGVNGWPRAVIGSYRPVGDAATMSCGLSSAPSSKDWRLRVRIPSSACPMWRNGKRTRRMAWLSNEPEQAVPGPAKPRGNTQRPESLTENIRRPGRELMTHLRVARHQAALSDSLRSRAPSTE